VRIRITILTVAIVCLAWTVTKAESFALEGRVLDPRGAPVAGAKVKLLNAGGAVIRESASDAQSNFSFKGVDPGQYQLTAESPSFVAINVTVGVGTAQSQEVTLQFAQIVSVQQSVTVVASSPSTLTPDPAQTVVIHDQVLDANPGRPGAPISIPGLPIETASGGIKAPQYFAPGVAGDHGEPIAQFFQIGNFLYPNNLPANAHGNGYADPNFLIPPIIEAVTVDGGAEPSTSVKETIRLTWRLLTFPDGELPALFNSPEIIATSTSWPAGIPKNLRPMPGLRPSYPLATDSSSDWSIVSNTSSMDCASSILATIS